MYLPAHFAEHDPAALHALMRARPLATLVTEGADGPVANHLPLRLTADGTRLTGHLARANPLWHTHPAGRPALAIFHGPDAYVTPGWYPGKHEHGKAVPTWNYVVVHARGPLRAITDPALLRAELERLVQEHEAPLAAPWQLTDAPADYIEKMLAAIVGIELTITALHGKSKLSQNQPADNRAGVIAGLRQRAADTGDADAAAVATLMESRREG